MTTERFDTVVIGGGQAGLAVGYHLARRGGSFVILDANGRIGDAWRRRWESLRLFTPARYDGLPGLAFPAPRWSFPTKDEMADYLSSYAARFSLPVRAGVRVDGLSQEGDKLVVASGDRRFEAGSVVVATGGFANPWIPSFATELDPSIAQLHSSEYRSPSQLQPGSVLVVGAGNSGGEIAVDVSRSRRTLLSGTYPGSEPTRPGSLADRMLTPVVWFLLSRVLTTTTSAGRKLRSTCLRRGTPLARVTPKDIAAAGVERVPRTVGVQDGALEFEDGRVADVSTVIWCTGFRPDFGWIDLPGFGEDGQPVHERGVVGATPGLYFVGLFFQSALTSSLVGGIGRDAHYIARCLTSRAG